MIEPFSMKFRDQYRRAFDLYVMGYWEHAKKEFIKAKNMLAKDNYDSDTDTLIHDVKDQLSDNILEYMESLGF